ncbi:hypothetical protein RHA1_ro09136 (plasmid) [Rhodococcus jostii RHA1]|uniref:Uncharacterized protein n=1 Tax=Rhodococcus jostii (strain RHA1) TaxID=101510 RepID=Q0RX07_RHOJR|nr:hypothetical protein RHA1_ro09136 [Rhodococcus jostii RHA1]
MGGSVDGACGDAVTGTSSDTTPIRPTHLGLCPGERVTEDEPDLTVRHPKRNAQVGAADIELRQRIQGLDERHSASCPRRAHFSHPETRRPVCCTGVARLNGTHNLLRHRLQMSQQGERHRWSDVRGRMVSVRPETPFPTR